MKIPVVKKLVEQYELDDLQEAESAIVEERPPNIAVEGEDEGEQLTHIFAAIWVKKQMQEHDKDFRTALREFSQKVRNSIS